MKIIASGFSGLIGGHLIRAWRGQGHQVIQLVRQQPDTPSPNIALWDPANDILDSKTLEGADAIIHLGGANIADRSWSDEYKKIMYDSRIQTTKLLAKTIDTLEKPPKTFMVASAIGIYGDRKEELLTEDNTAGDSWLASLVSDWEAASQLKSQPSTRIVNLRLGIVLSPQGGALAKMLTPFKLGVGGPLGDGQQYWSWISLDDAVNAIDFCLNKEIYGPVNLVSPQPLTNRSFSKILASTLKRPCIFTVPKFAINLAMGELGRTLLLESAKVIPKKLQEAGFQFKAPTLNEALEQTL